MKFQFQVLIQRDEDGDYIASCPAIKGCHSQGSSYEEALENIREAMELCVEHLAEKGDFQAKELQAYPRFIATENVSFVA